jgi:hypothetical protein
MSTAEREATISLAGGRIRCRRCQTLSRRSQLQCKKPALKGKRVCGFHGGKSTGPKTAAGRQRIAESKTIHGRETRAIRAQRSADLRRLEDVGRMFQLSGEHVFANPATGKPYVSIQWAWNTARIRAGMPEVRVHDLRHSFASLLINSGRSLYEVQTLLGHTQVKDTQRYAHLAPKTLLDASNAATIAVGSVMGVMPNRVVDVPLVAVG